jgi:hypothetical protein
MDYNPVRLFVSSWQQPAAVAPKVKIPKWEAGSPGPSSQNHVIELEGLA